MLLNQYGTPLSPTGRSPQHFGVSGGQVSREYGYGQTGADLSGYVARPRSPWDSWRFQTIDFDDDAGTYSVDRLIEILLEVSPEINAALWYFNRFINPEFTIIYENEDARSEDVIGQFLDKMVLNIGGIDVSIEQMVLTLFIRGAIFGELVLNPSATEAVDFIVRDPITTRFQRRLHPERGWIWEYGQWIGGEFIGMLDDPTIFYMPLDPFPGAPYGRPIVTSAISSVITLIGLLKDIRRVIANQGYPRLDIAVELDALQQLHAQLKAQVPETSALPDWIDSHLQEIAKVYNKLKPDEAFIHTSSIEVRPHPGALNAQMSMLDEIVHMLERQIGRALKMMNMVMGVNESTTETHAVEQWVIQNLSILALQETISVVLSQALMYVLQVQGIMNHLIVEFAENSESQAKRRAEVAQIETQTRIQRMDAGIIDLATAQTEDQDIHSQYARHTDPRHPPRDNNRRDDGEQRFAVQITPDGSDDPLPDLPNAVTLTDADAALARSTWNGFFSEYKDLLTATTINMALPGDAFTEVLTGDWQWNQNNKLYRNTETGRNLTELGRIPMRDELLEKTKPAIMRLTNLLETGKMNIQEFELAMRRLIKRTALSEYAFAKGGFNAMHTTDLNALKPLLLEQYQYLHRFTADIAAGDLSVAQITNRSTLYIDIGTSMHERGKAASYGIVLPEYPGDGNQLCKTRCRCRWHINELEDEIHAFWFVNPAAEHCDTCIGNTAKWAPYILQKQ